MPLSPARHEELKKRAEAEQDIDYSDIPELDETFFRSAKLVEPSRKEQVTMRIDADVLEWFKARGKGYQTRMNAVLKAYVLSQTK
ncbi:MAG TPA: BrnA antitoxin family protein [Ensifer sp.]|nr:BrnA antitoxin family protein [Ensifer sp.]